MINRRQKHTQTKAYQEAHNQYLILQICMHFEKLKIKNGQANKQKTTAQVTPYVDLNKKKYNKKKTLNSEHEIMCVCMNFKMFNLPFRSSTKTYSVNIILWKGMYGNHL